MTFPDAAAARHVLAGIYFAMMSCDARARVRI